MDVLIITSSYPLNPEDSEAAAGLFVRDFAAEMAGHGYRVRVLTQDRPGYKDDDPTFEVTRYPWRGDRPLSELKPTRAGDLLSILSVVRGGMTALDGMVAEERPDLVVAMWAVPAGLIARRAKRSSGVPYRVWALGSDIWGYGRKPLTRWIVRSVLRGAERNFADGIALAEEASRLSGKQVDFLPSSRNLPIGQPMPNALKNGKKNFVFIGRFHENKGVDLLVEAIGLLGEEHLENSRFFLFGGGRLEDPVKRKIDEFEIMDSVFTMGYADYQQAAAYLEHCHALVIPSRIESIPVILSDAIQARCPVVACAVGDMGRIVESSSIGVVVQPDPVSIRDGLANMLEKRRADFGDYFTGIRDTFSLGSSVKKILTDQSESQDHG